MGRMATAHLRSTCHFRSRVEICAELACGREISAKPAAATQAKGMQVRERRSDKPERESEKLNGI